jgi:uncharacterized protein (TIGR00661 family)
MKRVIVAPLNWGLGHATRCIPIINALINAEFTPIIASDGKALQFLEKEFPTLETLELPSYQISYGKNLKFDLLKKFPRFLKVMKEEHRVIQEYIQSNEVVGIISDNRFGVYTKNIPSVYLTHQLNVKSGIFTPITSYFHQRIIKKFDECWIPDEAGSQYSGMLSRTNKKLNQKFIGVLSRFEKIEAEKIIDILIVLSGPEPNRSILETKLIQKLRDTDLTVYLVRGKVEAERKVETLGKLRVINFAGSTELNGHLNLAKKVICRSGYSSIMDLVTLEKEAILIPTQGQSEQEYLAKYLSAEGRFEIIKEKYIEQYQFKIDTTSIVPKFKKNEFDTGLFGLFHRE